MKCPKCGKNNAGWVDYCVFCGSRQRPVAVRGGGPSSGAGGLPEIRQHLNEMAVRLSRVEGRVSLISELLGLERAELEPAVTRPKETTEVDSQPEIMGGSLPVEVLGAERQPAESLASPTSMDEAAGSELNVIA